MTDTCRTDWTGWTGWTGWAQYQHSRCVPFSLGRFQGFATVAGHWETYAVDGQSAREVRRDLWRRQAHLRPDPAKRLLLDIFAAAMDQP